MAMLRSLLLLFVVFSMGKAGVKKCPYGWTNFGVRCYKFFSQTVNWVTAERNCLSLDANLASVHSKIEQDFLLSLLPSPSTRCWFGTHDGNHKGQWLWTDGTPYDYTNWGPSQPSGGTENCGEFNFNPNLWNDQTCANTQAYVCAKDL
ncbi:galactose-specific lectin nattectin-like [Onychostoma macrolepis]|uniref:galactose-specific lectin nattectin-like n=1 Tax=Onychostoma macrolepis TaxID=369639 RepID=UPI00272D5AA3|nr:galactose-specific lectin nattectin-like [Onychostoma macrolepis]XP_058615708.1 galactose-specific lectin nattectin-like [Onychostoma macrolepis]XP_058615709.1 galactose-specific lectin nattectin-like [Onychostoma macrolepis]XP_058615710.1 galactose-specific lectin nattectin-like [Onychostoma macrolepis]